MCSIDYIFNINENNGKLFFRAQEGKHTRKKLQLWHAASTEDSRRYASVIIPVLEIDAHGAHVRRTKESWEDQKAG